MTMIIVGEECETCIYDETTPEDLKQWKVRCSKRNRVYRWGQCIDCDDREKIKIEEE